MTPPPNARTAPATARNREPILAVLQRWLTPPREVVEIAAGSGEHALWFAGALPDLTWRPTDRDPAALASIAAWREAEGPPNLLPPLALDAAAPDSWPIRDAGAVVCINMLHISPWTATRGLMAGAGRVLPQGGVLYLYGPFIEAGTPTAASNLAFDADLKARNPDWGLRDVAEVVTLAQSYCLTLRERVEMPANNLSLVFTRR